MRRSCGWIRFCFAIGMFAPITAMAQAPAGGISGQVTVDGRPLAGAIVMAAPLTPAARQQSKKYSFSDAAGSFSVSALEDDDYAVCVFVEDDQIVNPCQWASERQQVSIRGGQKAKDQKITVKRGAVLRVHLLDPHTLLPSSRYPGRVGVSSLVGVFTSTGFLDARQVSENSRGFEYRLAIPTGLKVKPYIDAVGARLLDASGALFHADQFSFRPATPNSPDLELTVTIAPLPAGAK